MEEEDKKSARGEGSQSGSTSARKQDSAKKEFFREELKRLKTNLDKEKDKINPPPQKKFTPATFNTLEPYYNVFTAEHLMNEPEEPPKEKVLSRKTATGLCDPEMNLKLDQLDATEEEQKDAQKTDEEEQDKKEKRQAKSSKSGPREGSTHLPKFPCVNVPVGELATKELNFDNVPELRKFVTEQYSAGAKAKIESEYKRTKEDFVRMELNKMEEYHPINRKNMENAYFAYLQNNPGSKKAVRECVKEVGAVRPGTATAGGSGKQQ